MRDPIDEPMKCCGSVFFNHLGGFTLSSHDMLNKGFQVTVGHKGGLDMLFLGGCATRLGNNVGSPDVG